MKTVHTTFFLWLHAASSVALAIQQSAGKLPALGWSSWNAYGCDIDANKISGAASYIQSTGLKDAGYEYVNIDDCWSLKSGRHTKSGELVPDPQRFPNGISGIADHVHSLGLKLGIYSSAGYVTCQGYPASLGNETLDAATFSQWGVDYLKYDNCGAPESTYDTCYSCDQDSFYNPNLKNGSCTNTNGVCPLGYDYGTSKTADRFRPMGEALRKQNRTIAYSLCEWGINEPWTWASSMGISWRTTNDLSANFTRVLNFINLNSFWTNYVDFYGHNDLDMLQIGNGLTPAESRSHFALWAIMKSPLLLGLDLSQISDQDLALVKNKHLLAFNQDATYGRSGAPFKWGKYPNWTFNDTHPAEYWSGQSSKGTLVAMFNPEGQPKIMQANWSDIPGLSASAAYDVVDVWTDKKTSCVRGGLKRTVESHDIAVWIVTESSCTPS